LSPSHCAHNQLALRKLTGASAAKLSAANAAKIALLKKAPKATFDDLYLQQQAQAHQAAWALHKGYATDGTDAALKQVASTAVPVIERHLQHAKQMLPAGLTPAQ
jgi:putative membrane protein